VKKSGQRSHPNYLLIAVVALALAGILLLALQFVAQRQQYAQDVQALTRVTAINAAAALVFDDRDAAAETLATLKALPNLRFAAIYDADRKLFVSVLRDGTVAAGIAPADAGAGRVEMGLFDALVVAPIDVDGRTVGTLVVRAGLSRVYWRLAAFALMFVLAAALALAIMTPAISRMRRQVALAAEQIREQASLLDKAQDAIVVMNLDRTVTYWNKGAERLYRRSAVDAIGQQRAIHDSRFEGARKHTLEYGEWRGELEQQLPEQGSVSVEGHWTLVRDEGGTPRSILAIETDISERKQIEARVARLSRLRAVHGGISSAILRLRDRDELLQAACRVAVTDGVFAAAWVGGFDPQNGEGELLAWFRERPSYLPELRFTAREGMPASANLVSQAAIGRKLIYSNDVAAEPGLVTICDALLAAGQRAFAACPLIVEDRVMAVLVLVACETDFFDADEVSLLEWLGADLSHALDHLEKSRRLDYLAYYDALTGLPNATLFQDRLAQFLHASSAETGVGVLLLDLERFTGINDTLGRDAGDAVLRAVARQLVAALSEPFTVARISADTFAIAIVCTRADCAAQLRTRVLEAMSLPVVALGRTLHVGAHAGIALHPNDGVDARALFKNAEAALVTAKARGERVVYYATAMNASMAERLQLEAQLHSALTDQQFVLHYQPRVDLRSGQVVGAEALIRWLHPSGAMVLPDDFIPLAEQTGLIVPIGEWVLNEACRQQACWLAAGFEVVPLGVNLSAVQFRRGDVLEVVRHALERNGLDGKHLELELTESTAMDKPEEAARAMSALRKLGVRLSLDDFGTGFSSLSYLKRFPLSMIKLDRTFVHDITQNPDDAAIAKAVIAMAHGMGLRVVAEGVETEAQIGYLRTHGCDEMQGNLFSPALSVADYERLVHGGKALALTAADGGSVGTLLLVDDEPGIRSALVRLLRRDGYRILTADSGPEGLELLALHPIRVIVSDQRMPGMSGTEFLEIARQLHPATIRILLSGYTDLSVVTDGVNRGAVYKFVTKPWDDDQLRELVRDAFRAASDRQAALEGNRAEGVKSG
jgi:diguanylate cyclase (GGDEF)-like protein/PAS domain S-box-containing protein